MKRAGIIRCQQTEVMRLATPCFKVVAKDGKAAFSDMEEVEVVGGGYFMWRMPR
ncbi:MAG: hypothetical protein LBH34_05585 [Prevotellaceae bacterium]|jgi:hypothetical protein|nr:hypothetical protein [Prevotellaceae bacterium]